MKFKNFFLSCSTSSGGRSRKLEEKQSKYGNLRPGSPPRLVEQQVQLAHPGEPPPPEMEHPLVPVSAPAGFPTAPAHKKPLSSSYSSYSFGSSSSANSSKSGCVSGSSASFSNPNSLSKSKRALDSRSGRHRADQRQKGGKSSLGHQTRPPCCIDNDFHQKFPSSADYVLNVVTPDDLGVKIGDRVVWLRESPYSNEAGKVKWIGIIENEEIAGIEFDKPLGLGSGWYKNRQLFPCEPQCGGLVAVAGLILEEDYFYNPDISTFLSSPTSNHHGHHSQGADKRLNSVGGSTGQSSPSPSPSSSSSASLDIGSFNSPNSPVGGFPLSTSQAYKRQTDYNLKALPVEEEHRYLPVQSSPNNFDKYGDTDCNYNWKNSGSSTTRFGERLPVVDCGDGPPSNTKWYTGGIGVYNNRNEMPMPFLQAPLREEDVERINGRLKGIQGHRNSCYLDATLFSMFSFSSVFDSILLQEYRFHNNVKDDTDEDLARTVQRVLRDDIVNPLRKDLYCNARNVMKLRETMQHLDDKLTSEEMDPQEFLQLLFDKVLNLEEFMSLSSGQSDFFHQVLVQQTEEDRDKIPSIQQLFEQSLMMQELKLKGVPKPALMLQMPRSGNKYKMYEGILPNLTIDITDLLEDIPRMCIICGSLATYECPQCYGKFSSGGDPRDDAVSGPVGSGAESTAFCETCLRQTHKRKDRQSHMEQIVPIKYTFPASQYFPNINSSSSSNNPSFLFGQSQNWGNPSFNRNPGPLISSIPPPTNTPPNSNFHAYPSRSIPRVTMDLFAVICIETSHFVSFVKCGQDRTAPWVFFDSMADRVENANGTGHNVPQVKMLPKMGTWLDQMEKNSGEIKKRMDADQIAPELKRLLSDPYLCLYYSPQTSMYS